MMCLSHSVPRLDNKATPSWGGGQPASIALFVQEQKVRHLEAELEQRAKDAQGKAAQLHDIEVSEGVVTGSPDKCAMLASEGRHKPCLFFSPSQNCF